jgi:hypothetical protein
MTTLHVAPVHLVADWDVLRLFQFEAGELPAALQRQLIALLVPLFEAEGMQLRYRGDLCWQLQLSAPAQIETTPIEWAAGGPLHLVMPQGADALRWKRLLNEAQMVLHGASIGQPQGQLAINGIWVWRDPSLMRRLRHWWQRR